MMGKTKLSLHVPPEHTITITSAEGASDSHVVGQLSCSNLPPQCEIRVILARIGRLKKGKETKNAAASRTLMSELGLLGSQKEQKRQQFDYDSAEKLVECFISSLQVTAGSKAVKCDFQLEIPSYLPATAVLPSVEISYAIFATCLLPNGKISRTSQNLRITRRNAEIIRLEPSRTVSFPESPLAIQASFDTPDHSTKSITIPTTLQLNGLSLRSTNSMRINETRWLVPREIKWEFEEIAVLITGIPDGTGHLPMSTARRILKKRTLSSGKEKLKLKYPFTRPGNTFIRMLEDKSGMQIPFNVTAPKDAELGDTTSLSVAGGHILHTIASSDSRADPGLPQLRFAVYLEYKLHIWLRIGEDVFDEASGDLVNRKVDEMAYTILCPLTTLQATHLHAAQQGESSEESPERSATPTPTAPPSYDGVWECPPPGYTIHS